MKILYTSPIVAYPPVGGPELRIDNSIKALGQVADVSLIVRTSKDKFGNGSATKYYGEFCSDIQYSPWAKKLSQNRYIRKIQNIFGGLTGLSVFKDRQFILKYCKEKGIQVVWFGYGNISFPLIRSIKRASPNIKVVCDTDSVWSRFVLRRLPYESGFLNKKLTLIKGRRKEREEQEWVNMCDITTAVSEVDAQYYSSLGEDSDRVRIFSNVIDITTYTRSEPPSDFKKPCMYLSGSFGYGRSPMDMATQWVLNDIFPKVRKRIPDMHLYIVGKGSDRSFGGIDIPGVIVTGKVPSVLPYLCNADVAIVPLRVESGTRFKILEAGACGTPVVSTTLGAEGIPVENGRDILLADDPDSFADAVVRITTDKELQRILSKNCRELVERSYSIGNLMREGRGILETLLEDEPNTALNEKAFS